MKAKPEVDWTAIENEIYVEGQEWFPTIANERPDDAFYVLYLDCDLQETCVMGHMNTEEFLHRQAKFRHQTVDCRPDPNFTVAQMVDYMRWDAGDFGGNCLFEGPEFDSLRSVYQTLYADVGIEAEDLLLEDFMQAVCRAVVRLEQAGVFDVFKERSDFRILCVYRTESIEDGDSRLSHVREALQDHE